MSTIILLNGCSSAGKSSITKAIQHLSDTPWLHFSLDAFINMMPHRYIGFGDNADNSYFSVIPGSNDLGPTSHIKIGSLGKDVFDCMPLLAKLLADHGNNLIIDEVLLSDDAVKMYAESLKNHRVYFVGVFAQLNAMQEREILRGDRSIGLANDQYNRVHTGTKPYDLKVDTTQTSAFGCAKEILAFIDQCKKPNSLTTDKF